MYTDPGILSLVIAAVVGSIIAIPTYIFIFRKKIGDLFHGKRKDKRDS